MIVYRLKLVFDSDNDFTVFGNKGLYSNTELNTMTVDRYYNDINKLNNDALAILKDIADSTSYNKDRPGLNKSVDMFKSVASHFVSNFNQTFGCQTDIEFDYECQTILVKRQKINVIE